eukprot:1156326-Pelagomonas_calceolata.AAC.5
MSSAVWMQPPGQHSTPKNPINRISCLSGFPSGGRLTIFAARAVSCRFWPTIRFDLPERLASTNVHN